MAAQPQSDTAAGAIPRRLFHFNAGFFWEKRLRRVLSLMGHELCLGLPGPADGVIVWGRSPYARRGEAVAARRNLPLIRMEDAFLRSVKPGRAGALALGFLPDDLGVHFDATRPSRLEATLNTPGLQNSNIEERAKVGIERLKASDLSKYNIHDPKLPVPEPGFILLIDQTVGDASLHHSGAGPGVFAWMLAQARSDHPDRRIVLKTHPETAMGLRKGHYSTADVAENTELLTTVPSPWKLLAAAHAVYTVSSQMGFEAILAGHRPKVFGAPFYAGWGLSDDMIPTPRRTARLTAEQLFAGAMILAAVWYDPCRDRLCSFEDALDQLEAETRAYREDRHGHVALGMRMWKRGRLQAVFGRETPLRFADALPQALAEAENSGRDLLVWASKEPEELQTPGLTPATVRRVEDGFLRSRGLGANLIPPLSLVADDLGIYYDPSRSSRLETLIQAPLPPGGQARAERLVAALIAARLSKYNLGGTLPDLPPGHRVLVPGQVEDDASIRLGAGPVRSNLALVKAARSANPQAVLIYKPHPDVEAGLRPGKIDPQTLDGLADIVAANADPIALLDHVDAVWTMTSLLGFEALIRGLRVTCLGAPFYAGWGLTRDLGPIPARRGTQVSLAQLAHAALIAYPRCFDPVSRLPCPPEVIVERLATGTIPRPSPGLRLLAKLQGRLASHAHLWR